MSAAERDALVDLIADNVGGDHHFIRSDMPGAKRRAREGVAGAAADAILAAGFVRLARSHEDPDFVLPWNAEGQSASAVLGEDAGGDGR